jgi:transcriptional regulator with XRE-family HTH domain
MDRRTMRDREKAGQTVFAAYLNVTPSLVSKWERGEKRGVVAWIGRGLSYPLPSEFTPRY